MDVPDHEAIWKERRRHPRVEVLGRIQGQLQSTDAAVTLLNMSQGGFFIETPTNIPPGDVREFLITITSTASFVIRARSVYSMRVTNEAGVTYAIGCEFTESESGELITAVLGLLGAEAPS